MGLYSSMVSIDFAYIFCDGSFSICPRQTGFIKCNNRLWTFEMGNFGWYERCYAAILPSYQKFQRTVRVRYTENGVGFMSEFKAHCPIVGIVIVPTTFLYNVCMGEKEIQMNFGFIETMANNFVVANAKQ